MSHNLYTINNAGGNVVSYHGAGLGVLYLGHGSTQTYPTTLNTGDLFEWYDPNPINTIGATLRTGSASDWYDQITLPAGTYWFRGYYSMPITSGSMYMHFDENGVSNFSGRSRCNSAQYYTERNHVMSVNYKATYSSSTNITFRCLEAIAITMTAGTARNRISETQYLFIRRLA